jgi:hypothetical protein
MAPLATSAGRQASPSISHDLLLTCVWIPRVGRIVFSDSVVAKSVCNLPEVRHDRRQLIGTPPSVLTQPNGSSREIHFTHHASPIQFRASRRIRG